MTSSTREPEAGASAPSHKSQLEMLILKLQTGAISEAERAKVGEQLGMALLLSPEAAAHEALQNSLARALVNFVKLNGAMMVFDFLDAAIKRLESTNQKVDDAAIIAALGIFSYTIEARHHVAEAKFRDTVEALINIELNSPATGPKEDVGSQNEKEAE